MSNAFEPMSRAQSEGFQALYLDHLRKRDGVPDLATQKFDLREKFFAALDAKPILWAGASPVDQKVFNRNHERASPEQGLDEVTLWALATAKTNRAERFGVEYGLKTQPQTRDVRTAPEAYIKVEEFYHTRILKDVLHTIGVEMDVRDPALSVRTLIRGMIQLPEKYSNVMILCGEVFGVAVFALLLEKARTLFSAQPLALARVEELFSQILVDEVGHVQYLRSTLSAASLAWARRLAPLVAWGIMRDIPELVLLFGREEISRRVIAADVEGAAAGFDDRLMLPAM